MDKNKFEKRRNSIWAKYERVYGGLIVKEIRDQVERNLRLSKDDDETLDDLDAYLDSNILIWKTLLHKDETSVAGDSTEAKPRKKYRKCFERRFYLVNFVIDRPYKRGTRIDWKHMVTEWNKSNPSDPMPLSTLRVEYQRAIKEDTLMLQVYIIRDNRFLTGLFQPLEKQLRNMANNNPFSFAFASLVGQKLWSDTQPLILSLNEAIRNSPMFKEIKAHNPEQSARLESELAVNTNMGDLRPLVEEINRLNTTREVKQNERSPRKDQ